MRFRNPANGHVEEKNLAWLWTLLFGGFYFIVSGLLAPFFIWIILSSMAFGIVGLTHPGGGAVINFVINVVFAIMAGGMVRSSYLRKGWIEEDEEGKTEERCLTRKSAAPRPPKMRKCPFCAEDIRVEAIKCKHCQSDVPPMEVVEVKIEKPSVSLDRPEGMSIGEWREKLIDQYQIREQGGAYLWNGTPYSSFSHVVEALRAAT